MKAAGIEEDKKGPLFRTAPRRSGTLTRNPMTMDNVWRMIQRRALAAGIKTEISCHSFRATGITVYLEAGGTLKHAQQIVPHLPATVLGYPQWR